MADRPRSRTTSSPSACWGCSIINEPSGLTAAELLAGDFGSFPELIRAHAAERPRAEAVIDGDARLTFAELDALGDRIAAAIQRDGVGPREAVAVCGLNGWAYAALWLGILRAGCVVAPLAHSATAEALAMMMADCGARLVFADRAIAATLDLPEEIAVVPLDDEAAFRAWLAPERSAPDRVETAPDEAFNIIYSSGTTGAPKGIVQSHAMRWPHFGRVSGAVYNPATRAMLSTPLYSNTTLVCFLPTLANGGCAVLMKKFDARAFLTLSERERATLAMLVPVQYRRIMADPDFDRFDLSAYVMKFCTSAPFDAALKAEILARWPAGLVEYYGMTEGGGTCILFAHEHPDKLHTVGRPAPGHDIRVIDEAGDELPAGATGEIVGRSASMMNGYHGQTGETRAAEWRDREGSRFIRTGDIGRFDADGFLTLIDRAKDLIISGGFNVYPSDIEAVLTGHPDVAEAAVIGAPSARWGETPVGIVVGAGDPEQIRAWANARLGKTQRLAAIHLVEALPRNAIGKVLKRELRARLGLG